MTTDNPLASAGEGNGKRKGVKRPMAEWAAHANAHLREIGRDHELEWVVQNGSTHLQWRR